MNAQQTKKEKGFTIIEVVLVLAIAGLIFLMVFIALPALQRGQRDQQRKSDISRAQTAINAYQSNNRGSLPSNWEDFTTSYLTTDGSTFIDPAGPGTGQPANTTTYRFAQNENDSIGVEFKDAQNIIYWADGQTCDGEGLTASGGRKIALRIVLEGGGVACVNN